jgi:hypothetical protein
MTLKTFGTWYRQQVDTHRLFVRHLATHMGSDSWQLFRLGQAITPSDFLLKDSTMAQLESIGVAKVLQSEKNAMEILDAMDI